METDMQNSDKEFLEQSLKFYKNIDKYESLLEINQKELEAFKNDMKIFLFVANKRYRSFTESFIRYIIIILRNRLNHLFTMCTNSKNYTKKMGEELGIITAQHRISWPLGWVQQDLSFDWLWSPVLK
jgi:hypothetical protein